MSRNLFRFSTLAGLIALSSPDARAAGTPENAPDLAACRSFVTGLIRAAKANDRAALKPSFRDPSDAQLDRPDGPATLARSFEMIEVVKAVPHVAGVSLVVGKLKPGQGPAERQGEEVPLFAVREEKGRLIVLSQDEMRWFTEREAPIQVDGAWSVAVQREATP